jgi:hypothetical protein
MCTGKYNMELSSLIASVFNAQALHLNVEKSLARKTNGTYLRPSP